MAFRDKIKSQNALQKLLEVLPKSQRVVFTNGVFDLLHAGHVRYLEQAKKLGHILVVALNEDATVRKLKGPTRPVNSLEDRMQVVAALESVDYVTSFKEEVPLKVILRLHPHILVKGGDYSIATIVGAREVQGWGGRVKVLPFMDGKSTTSILARAKP